MNTLGGLVMFAMILVVMLAMMLPLVARAVTFIPPVECEIGKECFIQNYVDVDPGPGVKDYQCGDLSYDGHKGTDFRVRDLVAMRAGVNVIAAAKGVVKAVRDGMADTKMDRDDTSDIAGRECGNGVVIEHNSGFETQYCHLMHGSVMVSEGEEVERGALIGKIGLSGNTEFPHLHFSVRQKGKVIDPFLGPVGEETQCGTEAKNLWHSAHRNELPYETAILLNLHYSDAAPNPEGIRNGEFRISMLTDETPALVIWMDAMALQKGDTILLRINQPDDSVLSEHSITLDRYKAQQFLFAGKKRPEEGWKSGIYRGTYQLTRDGQIVDTDHVLIKKN